MGETQPGRPGHRGRGGRRHAGPGVGEGGRVHALVDIVPDRYCTLLYCTVIYCTVLYFTVLQCTVMYFTVPYCAVLCCKVSMCCPYFKLGMSPNRLQAKAQSSRTGLKFFVHM